MDKAIFNEKALVFFKKNYPENWQEEYYVFIAQVKLIWEME